MTGECRSAVAAYSTIKFLQVKWTVPSPRESALTARHPDGVGRASIAWSPDGRVVAVHQSGPSYGFRLLSVADAYEIGRWEVTQQQSDDGRCSSAAMPMAFTDDGKALWVTCRVSLRNVPVTFPVAVKHRLPDLVAEDRIELKTPIADAKASDTHYLLTRIGAKQSLSALIGYFVPGKTRYFSYAFDLEHKTEIFPHFETAGDTRSGTFQLLGSRLRGDDRRMLPCSSLNIRLSHRRCDELFPRVRRSPASSQICRGHHERVSPEISRAVPRSPWSAATRLLPGRRYLHWRPP